MKKKTVIIGASENPERYAFMAAHRLVKYGHPIVNLGKKEGTVAGEPIHTNKPALEEVDTVTLYVNPTHQKEWYAYILALQPKRIIFNPNTENNDLEQLAREKGIETVEGCTLVMLGSGQF
jgi:uncharacterized protein